MKSKIDKGNYFYAVFQPLIILSKYDQQHLFVSKLKEICLPCMAAWQGAINSVAFHPTPPILLL